MNIIIFDEADKAHRADNIFENYPNGIGTELATIFKGHNVKVVSAFEPDCGLSPELLAETDVLFWWGHRFHADVPDTVTNWVVSAVHSGMGFVALHSSHLAKPFKALMGTSCCLRWRDGDRERVWITSPGHKIAEGLPPYFEIDVEEMYGEHFDIPMPDDLVAIGWFAGGEVCKSVCAYTRGAGKVAYIQFGHEAYPVYKNEYVRKMIANAAEWAKPTYRAQLPIICPNPKPLEARS